MTKKVSLIGNWKSYKTAADVSAWFVGLAPLLTAYLRTTNPAQLEIILCIPSVYLPLATEAIRRNRLPIQLAAQNVSSFGQGPYTGETTAEQLKDYANYVLIGHSERRTLFHETDEDIAKKTAHVIAATLTPIVCIQNADTPLPANAAFVAYEPITAIGTGRADTPANATLVATAVKQKLPQARILYGGSVTKDNIAQFLAEPDISGVLIGKASLDPRSFCDCIIHATHA